MGNLFWYHALPTTSTEYMPNWADFEDRSAPGSPFYPFCCRACGHLVLDHRIYKPYYHEQPDQDTYNTTYKGCCKCTHTVAEAQQVIQYAFLYGA